MVLVNVVQTADVKVAPTAWKCYLPGRHEMPQAHAEEVERQGRGSILRPRKSKTAGTLDPVEASDD